MTVFFTMLLFTDYSYCNTYSNISKCELYKWSLCDFDGQGHSNTFKSEGASLRTIVS